MALKDVEIKCKDNLCKINDQRCLNDELIKRIESNEMIEKLINKITKLENIIEIQRCYINVSHRVSEELKLQFDNLAQEKEERLVIVRTKTEKDETPILLKKEVLSKLNEVIDRENLTELQDVSNEIKYIHSIGRKKSDSQDILLVLNNKITKKKVYNCKSYLI